MTFKKIELSYDYEALEPVIDKETMHVHYDKHHQGYTDKLNAFCESEGIDTNQDVHKLITSITAESPTALRNNLGGYHNHNMYWENLTPGGKAPSESFKAILLAGRETMEDLRDSLVTLGMGQFASGWAWLTVQENGELKEITTANQDHPMMPVLAEKLGGAHRPILTIDVWEHAYYLQYKSSRKEYLEKIFEIIDWEVVEQRYNTALAEIKAANPGTTE
jgi:Fe-Mn family superoxide dismutase